MPDSVAAVLKEARERHDRSLRDVAAVLNIRYVYLQAIEAGEFNKLPGNAYAIGFLRSYAEYLELDSDDLVTRFKAEVAGLDRQTQLVFPTPVPEGKVPGGALILVSVLFFGLAYGAWSFFSKQDGQVADLVPAVPERLQDLLAEDQAGVSVAPAESVLDAEDGSAAPDSPDHSAAELEPGGEAGPAAPEESAGTEVTSSETEAAEPTSLATTPFKTAPIESDAVPAGSSGAEPATTGGATPSAEPAQPVETTDSSVSSGDIPVATSTPEAGAAQQTPTTPSLESSPTTIATAPERQAIPAAPPTGETAAASGPLEAQVYGRGNIGTRIILRATQDSWVQVRDRNEDLLFTRVLRAGDSYQVPNQSGLTLLTGNAGGLEIEVDGTVLGALGPVGTVRRNVALEPAGLLDGSTLEQ